MSFNHLLYVYVDSAASVTPEGLAPLTDRKEDCSVATRIRIFDAGSESDRVESTTISEAFDQLAAECQGWNGLPKPRNVI